MSEDEDESIPFKMGDAVDASRLVAASQEGDLMTVKILLAENADVNGRDKKGNTALVEAVWNDKTEILQLLLRENADPDLESSHRLITPLVAAANRGNVVFVTRLLRAKASINLSTVRGFTALGEACSKSQTKVAKLLLDVKADMSKAWGARSALAIAAERGNTELMGYLMLLGAKVTDEWNDENVSPLILACLTGKYKAVEELIHAKANCNTSAFKGNSPLFISSQFGHYDICQLLLQNEADVNSYNPEGFGPLHVACRSGYLQIVEVLLARNASPNKPTQQGATPLGMAVSANQVAVARLLITSGARVNHGNIDAVTPLMMAASHAHLEMVRMLCNNRAELDVSSAKDGNTALHKGVLAGACRVVEHLLMINANPNIQNYSGETPLHIACFHIMPRMSSLLISYNANVSLVDEVGRTPMSLVKGKHPHAEYICKLLLQAGAVKCDRDESNIEFNDFQLRSKAKVSTCRSRTPAPVAKKASTTEEEDWFCYYFPDIASSESMIDWFRCEVDGSLGRLYLTQHYMCFVSEETKIQLDFVFVHSIQPRQTKYLFDDAIAITIKNGKEVVFESFWDRGHVMKLIMQLARANRTLNAVICAEKV